jgi:hypothetical protein
MTAPWSNHEVAHRVLKEALYKANPNKYKPSIGIDQHGFGNRSARCDIIFDLYNRFGTITPGDIKNINLNIYKPYGTPPP